MSDNNIDELFTAMLGGSIILITFIVLILLAILIIYIIGLWNLFKKANKPGWAAIIPFYNTYTLVEIAGLNWWYFLIAISPSIAVILKLDNLTFFTNLATTVVEFCIFYNLAKKMKQNPVTYGILGIFFQFIMVAILGLSPNYKYDNDIEVSKNGPFEKSVNNTKIKLEKYCLGCGQKINPNNIFCENCGKKVE